MPRICLVTREHHPAGGGIGVSVPALAATLAAEHDVTLITDGTIADLLEAPDYCGEAHVALQAARTGHPLLAMTVLFAKDANEGPAAARNSGFDLRRR